MKLESALIQMKDPSRAVVVAALLLAIGIFMPTFRFGFVHDDVPQILENPTLRSWSSLPGFFTHHLWAQGQQSYGNYYRPVFQCWLLLNYALFGANAWKWHLILVLLHGLVTWLVYVFGCEIIGNRVTAAIGALLFAVQPVHIENVAWVSGGVDPLLAVFLLTSALALVRSIRSERRLGWALTSFACFVLALLTKETAAIFPIVVLLVMILYPKQDNELRGTRGITVVGYFALVLVYLFVRWRVLSGFEHPLTTVSWNALFLTMPSALFFYIRHQILPIGLSLFYDQHYVTRALAPDFLMPLLLLLCFATAIWRFRQRTPVVALLSCWFFLLLLPCLNLRAYQAQEVAHDRYLYLPSVAFCLLLAISIRHVVREVKSPNPRILAAAMCSFLGIAYSFGTLAQEVYYRDNYTLAVRGVTIAPNNTAALLLFARELTSRGRTEDALAAYQRLTTEVPDWWTAWYERGEAALRFQNWQEAETAFARSVTINPREASQYYLRALADLRSGNANAAREALQQGIDNSADLPMFRQGLQELQERGTLGPPSSPL